MTFQPGQSGNPAGRAVGSRNKKTLAVEAALFDHAQELVQDLVRRAKNGEPAAMRLCMERILPVGRGRPLPIALPAIRSSEDALAAADVIMDALKEGAVSAREAVDLLRVVEGLTRLTGAIDFIKKVARREVARAAQTLGMEHFFAGPPAANDYARRLREINEDEEARAPGAAQHEAERSDALQTRGPGATDSDMDHGSAPHRSASASALRASADLKPAEARVASKGGSLHAAAHPGNAGLQIVADSHDAGPRAEAG